MFKIVVSRLGNTFFDDVIVGKRWVKQMPTGFSYTASEVEATLYRTYEGADSAIRLRNSQFPRLGKDIFQIVAHFPDDSGLLLDNESEVL